MQIDNKDKLCLPRAIVVGRAYIQHFEEKSLSNYEYRCIVGSKKSHTDRQGELARELCARAGINVEEYCSKTFGMEEVKVFAQLLAPKYGIAVHNSLTANSKVFEHQNMVSLFIILLLPTARFLKHLLQKTIKLFLGSTYLTSVIISGNLYPLKVFCIFSLILCSGFYLFYILDLSMRIGTRKPEFGEGVLLSI